MSDDEGSEGDDVSNDDVSVSCGSEFVQCVVTG